MTELKRTNLTRLFRYAGIALPDPDTALTPLQVRDFFAAAGRPELATAEIRGPELEGNTQLYTFQRAVGTKGLRASTPLRIESEEQLDALAIDPRITKAMNAMSINVSVAINPTLSRVVETLGKEEGRAMTLPKEAIRWFF